ncbi:MAG: hypothetical protein WCF30_03985 [Terracidiphilus sp.]
MTPAVLNRLHAVYWSLVRYGDSGVPIAPPVLPQRQPIDGWWMKAEPVDERNTTKKGARP